MKQFVRYIFGLLFLFAFNSQIHAQKDVTKPIGNWSGKLDVMGSKLEIIFKISKNEDGKLSSKLDVPLQGAKDLPVSETLLKGDSLSLSVAMILGKFTGKFTNDSTINGSWKQAGTTFPLILKKTNAITVLKRPQTPKEPFPYVSENVEYVNKKSGFKLAGTLTLPENVKNCPAAILISGSGAQDRDETLYEHKPFLVIADFLTRNGIAVLRVDDRGVGGSEGNIKDATSEDFAEDVMAGVEFLKGRNEINSAKIGLIGHSEGGIIAPMVAAQSKDIAYIVLLAGPGINGEEILYLQGELINKAAGLTDDQIAKNRNLQKSIVNIIQNGADSLKQTEKLQEAFSTGMFASMNDDQKKAIVSQINSANTPWFRFFLAYNPYPTLMQLKCPLLALIGSKDLQVPPKQNLTAIEKALKEGGNQHFKTIEIDGVNHLFQNCKTGAVIEYAEIEETFSPEVLDILKKWILDYTINH